jgi:hypothetical protein
MKRPKVSTISVVVPGAANWELWQWADGGDGRCVAEANTPAALNAPRDATICLPAADVAASAIWLSTKDDAMVAEMAALQAVAVFHRDPEEGLFACCVVRREEARSLAFAVSAETDPPSLADVSLASQCTPSFCARAFASDTVTVYRELGALIAVVTSGEQPVGMLRLGSAVLDGGAAAELQCFVLRLEAEGIAEVKNAVLLEEPKGDFRWPMFDGRPGFGIPSQPSVGTAGGQRPPAVCVPRANLAFVPQRFREAMKRERARQKLRLVSVAVACAAGIFLAIFFVRYGWLEFQCHRIEAQNAALRPEAAKLQAEAARWEALEPAVNPDLFAIEWMHQFSSRLPQKGVRLTLFHLDEKELTVTGEADRAAQAVAYQEELAGAPQLAALHLSMPPPKLLPNDLASFEITGLPKGGASHEGP